MNLQVKRHFQKIYDRLNINVEIFSSQPVMLHTLKRKNNSKNFSSLAFLILILSFLLVSFVSIKAPLINTLNEIDLPLRNIFNILKNILVSFLSLKIEFLFFFLPPIAITACEYIYTHSFNTTSLGKIKKSKGYKYADIWYFLFKILTAKVPVLLIAFTLRYTYFENYTSQVSKDLIDTSGILSNVNLLIAFIAILMDDFQIYLVHYINHKIPLLWKFHEFHHSATEMTILSRYRVSHFELFAGILTLPIRVFSGFAIASFLSQSAFIPVLIILSYNALSFFIASLGHSSHKWIFPKFLSWAIFSPSLHWLHHSTNPDHFDKNFGSVFVFWDKIFNTYLDESHLKNIKAFGVENSMYNKIHPFNAYFIHPFIILNKSFNKFINKLLIS